MKDAHPGSTDRASNADGLRNTISHIVAFSTLSAVWVGAPRSRVAEGLAQVLREALDADVVYVGLRGTGGDGACDSASLRSAELQPVCGAITREVAAWLRTPDPAQNLPALSDHLGRLLVTPIGISAEHGVVVTAPGRADFPTETDRLLLNVAANQATLALLSERARDEQRIADTLQRIGTSVAAEMDPEKVIQTVTDEATALTGADFGAFFYNVIDPSGESYMLFTLAGAPREAFSRFPMPRNTAIFEPTFKGSGAVRLSDVTADPGYGHNAPYHGMPVGHLPVRSYLAVPVISRRGKVHGGLFFGHKDVGVFLERHERLAVGVAAWAALAMDNGYLYAEAQRANQAKDQFLATLSHELRTPLNAIVGWLSMLRRPEVMTAAGVPKAWDAIDRNTKGLADLIEDLLDVSRIATGKIRLAETDVDLNDVARESVRAMEPTAVEKRVALLLTLSPRPCIVRGDVGRLRQIAGNLLANAIKFTPSGGNVAIAVAGDERTVTLTVSDTGIGIHPNFLPHVFERFRQATTDPTTGLGLGLAIVKNLVEVHGGTVTAASDGIGRGARFTITFPRI